MTFFIPFARDKHQARRVYHQIREYIAQKMEAKLSPRKIALVHHTNDGKEYYAEVGKVHSMNDEIVIAILYEERRDLYYVCTENRGVINGLPIIVDSESIDAYMDFDYDPHWPED